MALLARPARLAKPWHFVLNSPANFRPVARTGNAEDISLPFVAERVSRDLSGHALLEERTEVVLRLNVERLLRPVRRVAHVELGGRISRSGKMRHEKQRRPRALAKQTRKRREEKRKKKEGKEERKKENENEAAQG